MAINIIIKGIILDVDGVIVGSKRGYNWPNPHPNIIQALKTLRSQGIFVSLCTGKGTFAIKNIVTSAHLDNLHIGDGGAVVVDVLNNKIIEQHLINRNIANQVIETYQNQKTYIELYTIDGYCVQKDSIGSITEKHAAILYQQPIVVDSLLEFANQAQIVKIMPIAEDIEDKDRIVKTFNMFKQNLSLQWGIHPTALPHQFGIITAEGISKKQAAVTISNTIRIPFEDMLGVGDSLTDWEFIQLCNYGGAMGNASNDLKEIIKSKPENHFTIGSSVDENGLLDIFKYYKLI